jgi:hypothetical protein
MEPKLSIVVAVRDGAANVPALLAALRDRTGDTEVILCCAGPCIAGEDNAALRFSLSAETLVPSLWSEGILRARGNRVALTTAEFVPAGDWLERLHAADLDRWVGVGGTIDNEPAASARNWAIFFLRYSAFAPPLPAGDTEEIAADNAVYDRAAILEHPDLLRQGFWEPSFHRRFRAAGKRLALDPNLVVVHHGTVSGRSFARQRHLHGRAYGIERAGQASVVRNLLLLLSSPLVPPLLLARILARIVRRPRYRARLFTAFPWLVRFTFAWATGEAGGYASTLFAPRTAAAPTSKRQA